MKSIFCVWLLLGVCIPAAISESNYDSDYLTQGAYHDSQDTEDYPNSKEHQTPTSYEYQSQEDTHSGDPRHYQSLESRHHQPNAYSTQYFKQYHNTPHTESHISSRQPQYYGAPEHVQYNQPEDPSYHRPQELVHPPPPEHYQQETPRLVAPYRGSPHHLQPENKKEEYKDEEPSYKVEEPRYKVGEPSYKVEGPRYKVEEPRYKVEEPSYKVEEPIYKAEEPKYNQASGQSSPSHRGPVPTDPKLPLYFTMYEKRTIQDPLNKYGKGPWRYLTYGHGISYGTKGPGKVFEKGYGYIRALGRDHCKLPEHLCSPRDEKPFDYEGRKEPYFGYRPH